MMFTMIMIKKMNFKNNELGDKIYQRLENIFEHIEKKLSITLNHFAFEKKRKLLQNESK